MMIYTTEELVKLLDSERDACMNGERFKLSATTASFSKEAAAILASKGIQQLGAYHDFRTEVWKYQAQNLISGIVWEEIEIDAQLWRFPVIDDQLISLPSDIQLLKSYKEQVVSFWQEVTQQLQLWRAADNREGDERPEMVVTGVEVEQLIAQGEWATLSANNFDRKLRRWTLEPEAYYQEINLQIGWGCPELAGYWQNWPEHGSEWIKAVNPHAVEPEDTQE